MSLPQYEVFAIRYATHQRMRSDNFIFRDAHDGPMPIDFFVWVLRSPERTIVVDTGFDEAAAAARQRKLLRHPVAGLKAVGVDAASVRDVVLTHLHYDHAGNIGAFPSATFHVQEAEVNYATGRCMCYEPMRHAYSVDDVVDVVRNVYADRVSFHNGDATIAPGVELLLIGGHTMGLQSVRVHTKRGWVVLASDASHYYENMEQKPFPIVYNVAAMLDGHRRLRALADSAEHVVPGHDPEVLVRYPRLPGDEVGIACLHEPPKASG